MCECRNKKIEKAFQVLSQECRELYIPTQIAEVNDSLSPLEFFRNYVSKNIPVVIRGGVKHWKAIEKWDISYFKQKLGDKLVTVAVTPNGYADAITKERKLDGTTNKDVFAMPEERLMTMNAFLETLENPQDDSVFYIQKQNSNFEDFYELWKDIDNHVFWATEAFGIKPDAVNFWMGDQRAVTSMHKDPYENIYCVVFGEKEFILHPPTDLPWIPYENYDSAIYKEVQKGKWITELLCTKQNDDVTELSNESSTRETIIDQISWIAIDPLNPNYEKYPRYKNAAKIHIKVGKGDILYLPSLWFHHVKQSHACIAVNYWYDMEYDIKYAYYKTLETLSK